MMIDSDFRPPWWLSGPHAQTLWASKIRRVPPPDTRRERLELNDGDFLDLEWLEAARNAPRVLVLHGLEGSLRSGYAAALMRALQAQGLGGVFLYWRGCSGEPNRLPRSYHSGETGDIATLVALLRERFPTHPLAAVGYSLGGNALLKYLGEHGTRAGLDTAVAVSVPLLLSRAADRLEQGLSRLYQTYLVAALRRSYRRKFRRMPEAAPVPLDQLRRLKTFRQFDDAVTAPLHGFAGVEDYYRRASSRQYLHSIDAPTLILQARDDPFMYPDVIPTPHELSPHVTLEVSSRGGHVGFVGGGMIPAVAHYGLETRILDHLQQALSPSLSPRGLEKPG